MGPTKGEYPTVSLPNPLENHTPDAWNMPVYVLGYGSGVAPGGSGRIIDTFKDLFGPNDADFLSRNGLMIAMTTWHLLLLHEFRTVTTICSTG